jgi:hypothetical protein
MRAGIEARHEERHWCQGFVPDMGSVEFTYFGEGKRVCDTEQMRAALAEAEALAVRYREALEMLVNHHDAITMGGDIDPLDCAEANEVRDMLAAALAATDTGVSSEP